MSWLQGFNDGYDEGREQGQHEVRNILSDLIAELREMGGEYDSGWAPLIAVADRAEARLREASGDE